MTTENPTPNEVNGTSGAGNGTEPDKKPEPQPKAKLKYNHIELCSPRCANHGNVYFEGARKQEANNFDDVTRICKELDDESAKKLRGDVAKLQAEGYLEALLAPEILAKREEERRAKLEEKQRQHEQRQQEQDRRMQDLLRRQKELGEKAVHRRIAKANDSAVAQEVGIMMTEGLDKAANELFREMSDRGMKIVVLVMDRDIVDEYLNHEVEVGEDLYLNLVIDPLSLLREDYSREEAELKADREQLAADVAAWQADEPDQNG